MNSEKEYALSNMSTAELVYKAKVVSLILSKDTEKALELLSQHYRVAKPRLKVGMPKRHSKKLACYVAKKRTIHVSSREALHNPHVILHEFYHHLRNFKDAQRGIEKYADKFAEKYLQAYRIIAARVSTFSGISLVEFVHFKRSVIESLLSYARGSHPREGILLLRGKVSREKIVVDDTLIAPLATRGQRFSSFPLYMLPIDFSIVGVAHSHPSGILAPSVQDLNHFYGRIMVIIAFPYQSEQDIAVFNKKGKKVKFEIIG